MNPLYKQMYSNELQYMEAVHKFHDALEAFKQLSDENKQRLFYDVICLEILSGTK